MGGQNHQPTNQVRLIAPSAWLSQKMGEGLVRVLEANNALEDAIMVGVNRLHVEKYCGELSGSAREHLLRTQRSLEFSLVSLSDIAEAYANLLDAAELENYKGNPLASRLKSMNLSHELSGKIILPEVNGAAWRALEDRIAEGNILNTLKWEAKQFETLRAPTSELIATILDCVSFEASHGSRAFVEAVECNRIPIRQHYGRVFSLWNHLHAMFLYSAITMTELFYRTNDFGSLLLDDNMDNYARKYPA